MGMGVPEEPPADLGCVDCTMAPARALGRLERLPGD